MSLIFNTNSYLSYLSYLKKRIIITYLDIEERTELSSDRSEFYGSIRAGHVGQVGPNPGFLAALALLQPRNAWGDA